MNTAARASMLLVAFLFAWAFCIGPPPVSAQDAAATPTAGTVTVDEGGQQPQSQAQQQFGVTSDVTAVELSPPMAFIVVLVLLALALLVLTLLFRYLAESRQDYYETIREFARRGVFFSPVLVSPTTTTALAEVAAAAAAAEGEAPPVTFEMAGPGLIAPGQGALFSALRNGVAVENTEWILASPSGAAVPAESATLDRTAGSSVTLTASQSGVYVLVARQPGPPELVVRNTVTVTEPPSTAEVPHELPFIGLGFGSIVGAIVVVAALVVLAATRAIDADVVGVILGALTGYLFGVGVTQSRT